MFPRFCSLFHPGEKKVLPSYVIKYAHIHGNKGRFLSIGAHGFWASVLLLLGLSALFRPLGTASEGL